MCIYKTKLLTAAIVAGLLSMTSAAHADVVVGFPGVTLHKTSGNGISAEFYGGYRPVGYWYHGRWYPGHRYPGYRYPHHRPGRYGGDYGGGHRGDRDGGRHGGGRGDGNNGGGGRRGDGNNGGGGRDNN